MGIPSKNLASTCLGFNFSFLIEWYILLYVLLSTGLNISVKNKWKMDLS